MKEPSPAHQHYPSDFYAETMGMNAEEAGAYIWLRGTCWMLGAIPGDEAQLARICKMRPSSMHRVWSKLCHLFEKDSNGFYTHPGMEYERKKQAKHRSEKQLAGKAGAAKRWQSHSSAIVLPMAEGMAENSFLSPSPNSVVSTDKGIYKPPKRPAALTPMYSSKRERFLEWLKPWPRCASEDDAGHAWVSAIESAEDEDKAFKARDRYLASSEVQRGAVMDPAKFLVQQKQTGWNGRWPLPPLNKQQQLVERIKNL